MSFRRDYKPLFSVHVLDDSSGASPDGVTLRPSAQCQDILADHQLLWQPRGYGLDVFYSLNPWASEPLLGRISTRQALDFSLQLPADFFAAYEPDLGSARQLHLFNLADDGSVRTGDTVALSRSGQVSAADAISILPERFELPVGLPAGATRIEVRAQFDDAVLLDIPVGELGGGARQTFDLRALGPGRFRLSPDNQPAQQTQVLLNNEIAACRAQGLLTVVLAQAQDLAPAEGYRFEARFKAR